MLIIYFNYFNGNGTLWIRPLDIFLSGIDHEKYPNVTQKYRFELQHIESVAPNFKA